MNSIRLVAIMALLAGGQAMAASTMQYTLELGGNNGVAAYENLAYPPFVPGNDSDDPNDHVYNVGSQITWDAVVEVSGIYDYEPDVPSPPAPNGVANMVVTLQLWDATESNLIQVGHATVVGGVPTTAGFYSTINDGDANGSRGAIETDPLENAAFCISYSICIADPNNTGGGRVYHGFFEGGPCADRAQYPSAVGLGGGHRYIDDPNDTSTYMYHYAAASGPPDPSLVPLGNLAGMGAGYSQYAPSGAPDDCTGYALSTAGIGMVTTGSGYDGLGVVPVMEGQINTTGMTVGTYVLKLVPGAGNNVLDGRFDPTYEAPPTSLSNFAMPADANTNQVLGDTIKFKLMLSDTTPPTLLSAKSVRTHGTPEYGIDLPLSGTAAVEMRSGGPKKLVFTFSEDIQKVGGGAPDCTMVTLTGGGTCSSVSIAGAQMTVDMTGATNNACTTATLNNVEDLAGNALTGDNNVAIRVIRGDSTANGSVTAGDMGVIKILLGQAVDGTNFKKDINCSNSFTAGDMGLVKANLGGTATCP